MGVPEGRFGCGRYGCGVELKGLRERCRGGTGVRSCIVRIGVTGVAEVAEGCRRRFPQPLKLGRGVWGAAGAQRWVEE